MEALYLKRSHIACVTGLFFGVLQLLIVIGCEVMMKASYSWLMDGASM